MNKRAFIMLLVILIGSEPSYAAANSSWHYALGHHLAKHKGLYAMGAIALGAIVMAIETSHPRPTSAQGTGYRLRPGGDVVRGDSK